MLTKQSGPLSPAASSLMCKLLVSGAAANGHSWCHKGGKLVCSEGMEGDA